MGTTITARRPSDHEVSAFPTDEDFTASYRSSLGRLVGFFRAKGVPRDEAVDLANETMVRMLVHLKRHGRDRTDLGPLVRTIARNLVVERVRKQAPVIVPLGDDIDVADDALEPVDQLVASERSQAVRTAIGSLSPRHRHVVGLWMDGRTPTEIARELGIKRNAVDAILHRARRSLAAKLDGGGVFGVLGVFSLRLRSLVRRLTEFTVGADPSGNISGTTTTLAAAGLAAALTLASPAAGAASVAAQPPIAGHEDRSSHAEAESTSSVSRGNALSEKMSHGPDHARSAARSTYEMRVGAFGSEGSGTKDEASIAEVSYDPEKNGRGPLDPLLESLFSNCASNGACAERRR